MGQEQLKACYYDNIDKADRLITKKRPRKGTDVKTSAKFFTDKEDFQERWQQLGRLVKSQEYADSLTPEQGIAELAKLKSSDTKDKILLDVLKDKFQKSQNGNGTAHSRITPFNQVPPLEMARPFGSTQILYLKVSVTPSGQATSTQRAKTLGTQVV